MLASQLRLFHLVKRWRTSCAFSVHSAWQYVETPTWFQRWYAAATLTSVANFSMEFMLSEALPIYLGRLGNVAGDQLKSTSRVAR
jgi:glucan phosphorylase